MRQRVMFAFGEWRLDPVAKVLFREGEPVHMTRKAVETLLVLVENAGRVLTKEEIMTAVWPDRVVDEANLAQNIAVVRRILAAGKGNPAWIETFPGRGYRLEGPVASESDVAPMPESASVAETPPRPVNSAPIARSTAPRAWYVVALGVALIGAGLGLFWFRLNRTPEVPHAISRVAPVTRMPGTEYQPSITPDGTRIAFVSQDPSAAPSVWVQDIGGENGRAISTSSGHHSSPAWSPDGTRVAFLRVQTTASEIVIVGADGRGERVLKRFEQPAYGYDHRMLDWSPDGKSIAVSRPAQEKSALALHLIDVETRREKVLTDPGAAVAGDVDPRFSPDGSRVSFIRLVHRSLQEIYTVPVAGGPAEQVTNLGRRISSHDWLPDGRALVFASDRGGEFRLRRLQWNPGEPAKQNASALGIYSEFPIQISMARRSDSLVYAALQQDRNIWRLNPDTLEWKRLIASTGQDASPQYSPKGDRICFRSDRSGEEQLWVSKADGTEPKQITHGSMRPSVGRWSPDGKSIVYNMPQTGEVWIASEGVTGWSSRKTGVQGVHPVFSRDAQWIYAGGPSGIVRFGLDGRAVESISTTKSEALAVSPDGEFLYFVREPTDTTLWRINLDSEVISKVLDGLVPGCTSCWALADKGVYFLGSDTQSFDRQVLYFWDGSRAHTVIPFPEPLWPIGSGPFSLGPDRNLLVVRVEPSNSDVMLVSSFR